jgi:hypothetical protein
LLCAIDALQGSISTPDQAREIALLIAVKSDLQLSQHFTVQ